MDNNKILRYLEGQLSSQDQEAFEALIESDTELQLEVEMLGNFIDNEPKENPPYQLRQKIYNMIGIKDESFMDVAIKKADKILDIILGKEYSLNIEPAFVTRSSQNSLLFSKKMNNYEILCDISSQDNGNFLMNLAASQNDIEQDNIKFSIYKNQTNFIEKYTQLNGNTGSFIIDSGTYYINISTLKSELGNIKISLS
tara:strand:+ start:534 stop:1127 length:594 start_codon:yes stop_codon:yes gene_type:complete